MYSMLFFNGVTFNLLSTTTWKAIDKQYVSFKVQYLSQLMCSLKLKQICISIKFTIWSKNVRLVSSTYEHPSIYVTLNLSKYVVTNLLKRVFYIIYWFKKNTFKYRNFQSCIKVSQNVHHTENGDIFVITF